MTGRMERRAFWARGAAWAALCAALALFFYTRPFTDLLPFIISRHAVPALPPALPPLLLAAALAFWLWVRTAGNRLLFPARLAAALPMVIALSVPLLPDTLLDRRWFGGMLALFFMAPVLRVLAPPMLRQTGMGRKALYLLCAWCRSLVFLLFVFLLFARGNPVPFFGALALLAWLSVAAARLSGEAPGRRLRLSTAAATLLFLAAPLHALGGMAAAALSGKGEGERLREAMGLHVRPYLQNLRKDGVTIMWESGAPLPGRVLVGGEPEDLLRPESPPRDVRVIESPASLIHEVTVDGLEEDRTYHYRVVSNGVAGETGRFRTAHEKPEPFEFAVYGDSQEMFGWAEYLVRNRHGDVCKSILRDSPGARFVVHVGDMTFLGNEYDRWGREFFGRAGDLMRDTVVWPVIGNHEMGAHWYFDYFSVPNTDERYYAFDYGNSRFIVLAVEGYAAGHTYGPPERTPMDPGTPQYEWLERTLAGSADKTWRFVFFHHPALSTGIEGNFRPATRVFGPLFEKYGVDAAFSGHDHDFEFSVRDGMVHVVTGGGGGPVSPLRPNRKENPHARYFKGVWHHCRVRVDGAKLKVRAVDLRGGTFFRFMVDKSGGSRVVRWE